MSTDHATQPTTRPPIPDGRPETWVYLADLTLPSEVQQRVERENREYRLSRKEMGWLLEGAKLCHFFPDRVVAYKHTPRGLLLMMVDSTGFTPEFLAWFHGLPSGEGSQVIIGDTFDPSEHPMI